MSRLVRAELLKARSTRVAWVLAGAALVVCVMWTVVSVLTLDSANNAGLSLQQRVQNVFGMAQEAYPFVLILGVLAMAGEHRHKTITWSFLVTPRRGRVVAAKLIAYALVGLAVGVACAAVTVVVAMPLLAGFGEPAVVSGTALVLLGSVLSTILYTLLGVGLGALVRSQVAGVIIVLVWFWYAEYTIVWMFPEVGRWLPSGAANAVSGMHTSGSGLLPAWAGGLLFLGYALVLAVVASFATVRRDVT